MKPLNIILPLLIACTALSSCNNRTKVQGYYSFYVPSSNYEVGQVWSIYKKPAKINIELQSPIFPKGKVMSSGEFDLSDKNTTKLVTKATVGIKNKLSARLGLDKASVISQTYTNARVIEVEGFALDDTFKKQFENSPDKANFLKDKLSETPPVKLEVATHILVADIVFTVDKSLVATVGADVPNVVEGMDVGLEAASGSSKEYKFKGASLAVAYQTDPNLIKKCLNLK